MHDGESLQDIGELREELQELARARSPVNVAAGSLVGLEAHAQRVVGHGDLDGVHALVTLASGRLAERQAVAVAALLCDDDQRWQRNLRERMSLAGDALGLRYDTFRRRTVGGATDSHYDDLMTALAEAIVRLGSDDGPGKELGSDPASQPSPRDGRRRLAALLALAGIVVVGSILAVTYLGADDGPSVAAVEDPPGPGEVDVAGVIGERPNESTPPPPPAPTQTLDDLGSVAVAGCDVPLGGSMNPVGLPDGVAVLMADAFADAGGVDALGCPLRTIEAWEQLWVQEFGGGELPEGLILADPVAGNAVWIDAVMYGHYRRSAGGGIQQLGGLPVAARYDRPHPVLELSGGGQMVAHHLGGPAHWVPVEAVVVWEELGGPDGALGLPMADVNYFDGLPGQEWSGGFGRLLDDGTIDLDLVEPAEIDAAVAALGRRSEGILRLYDQTAYWIDEQGRRRWIPDGDTWFCLGGESQLIEEFTPGWVVGAFPMGPNAECPSP